MWQSEKSRNYHTIFIVLLILGLMLRLLWVGRNFQLDYGDGPLEYLTVSHMATFHEYPEFGSTSMTLSGLPTSPLYYWFLVPLFLVARNNISFGLLTVFLNLASIIFLYLIANRLFGKRTAVITGVLLLCSQPFLDQTFYFWCVWLGQTLYLASYLLMTTVYFKKNHVLLLLSACVFIAGMISSGSEGFGSVVGYLLIFLIVSRSIHVPSLHMIGMAMVSSILLGYTYLPIVGYVVSPGHLHSLISEGAFVTSVYEYLGRFILNWSVILEGVVVLSRMSLFWQACSVGLFGWCVYVAQKGVDLTHKKRWLSISILVITTVAIASFLKDSKPYYFNAVNVLLVILLGDVLSILIERKLTAFFILLSLSLYLLLPGPAYIRMRSSAFSVEPYLETATAAMITASKPIQQEYGMGWTEHITLVSYESEKNAVNPSVLEAFFASLEQGTGKRFVRFSPLGKNYVPLAVDAPYFFVICSNYSSLSDVNARCVDRFLSDHPFFVIRKTVYHISRNTKYVIFLAENIQEM